MLNASKNFFRTATLLICFALGLSLNTAYAASNIGSADRDGVSNPERAEKIQYNNLTGTAELVTGRFVIAGTGRLDKAINFFNEKKVAFKISNPAGELNLLYEKTDDLGKTHLRFQQVYDDIPVWGAQTIVHFDSDNNIYMVGGQTIATPTFSTSPAISAGQAESIAINGVKNEVQTAVLQAQSELVIFPNDGDARLSRMVTVTSPARGDIRWRVFVDAGSGEILFKFNDIHYDGPDAGSGYDVLGVLHNFPIYLTAGQYQLRDVTRIGEVRTYVDYYGTGQLSTDPDADKVWDDNTAQEAEVAGHVYAAMTYDFFTSTFGRESFDGFGSDLIVNIHDPSTVNNAYWNGTSLNFGDGDGTNFLPFSGSLDVVAHEMTHGVTQYNGTGGLIYTFMSGALNESYSDVFGSCLDTADWLLGEDIRITGLGFIRSMSDPNIQNDPKHMSEYFNFDISNDNGGVHSNSGIPNHCFYLAVTSSYLTRAEAEQIWYRTLTNYLTPSCGFYFWAGMQLQSTIDLYGQGSNQFIGMELALYAVGLGAAYADPDNVNFEATIGDFNSMSIWVHNPGSGGTVDVNEIAPALPGLTLTPGPGYQSPIPDGDSSEFVVAYDATALGECDLGFYTDSLRFTVDGPFGITDMKLPITVALGDATSSLLSQTSSNMCTSITPTNTGAIWNFSQSGNDIIYDASLHIGQSIGDDVVYRHVFNVEKLAPVDVIANAPGSLSVRIVSYDAQIQGEAVYTWNTTSSDSCSFFVVDYYLTSPCGFSGNILTGLLADFDVNNSGSNVALYNSTYNLVYVKDNSSGRCGGMALLSATPRNLRSIHNPDLIYGGDWTDATAYNQMLAASNVQGTTPSDYSALLTFGQDAIAPNDTVHYQAALLYSTTGEAGLIDAYGKAQAFANPGPVFEPGDANGDGSVNVGDAVTVINYVFNGGPAPDPLESGDANCDGFVNIGDAVFLINFIFSGGPAPAPCP